jgi:hypothetical protein
VNDTYATLLRAAIGIPYGQAVPFGPPDERYRDLRDGWSQLVLSSTVTEESACEMSQTISGMS